MAEYRPSPSLWQVILRAPSATKKNQVQRYVEICIGVIDWATEVLGGTPVVLFSGVHTLTLKPVWIGWSNDAGETFMTDEGMIALHGMKRLTEILVEYPLDKQ
jgi:hypothetical protein